MKNIVSWTSIKVVVFNLRSTDQLLQHPTVFLSEKRSEQDEMWFKAVGKVDEWTKHKYKWDKGMIRDLGSCFWFLFIFSLN